MHVYVICIRNMHSFTTNFTPFSSLLSNQLIVWLQLASTNVSRACDVVLLRKCQKTPIPMLPEVFPCTAQEALSEVGTRLRCFGSSYFGHVIKSSIQGCPW